MPPHLDEPAGGREAELDARAQAAAKRGSLLFHLFLAEALAGDALAAIMPEAVEGWALDVGVDGYEVTALGGAGGGEALRRVTFGADGAALVEAPLAPASARLRRLAAAREACAAAAPQPHRYAAIVAPPPRDGPDAQALDGYLVRLPERAGDMATGPHWRLRLDGHDGHVRETTLICAAEAVLRPAGRRSPTPVTHAGALSPSEMHVLLSLQHGAVLDVLTPDSASSWRVDGERVTRR